MCIAEMAESNRDRSRSPVNEKEKAQYVKTAEGYMKCKKCDVMFWDFKKLQRHWRTQHLTPRYICPKCTYRTNRSDSLTKHLKVHAKDGKVRSKSMQEVPAVADKQAVPVLREKADPVRKVVVAAVGVSDTALTLEEPCLKTKGAVKQYPQAEVAIHPESSSDTGSTIDSSSEFDESTDSEAVVKERTVSKPPESDVKLICGEKPGHLQKRKEVTLTFNTEGKLIQKRVVIDYFKL